MNFLKISYQGGGLVRIQPEYVSHMRYFPEIDRGKVVFYLKNGEKIDINSCSKEDAQEYIKLWKEALEGNQGQLSEVPFLTSEEGYNGKTESKPADSEQL